jgi:hypothetical protein
MELLLILIVAGVIGYFFGRSRRSKASIPASQQVVDVEAKDSGQSEKTEP